MSATQSAPVDPSSVLRIHAAAVAAQQSALVEVEARLRERGAALALQENQIGASLDEKRRLVEGLHAQLAAAREELRQERAELARQKRLAVTGQAQADELRARLRALHGRFVRRFKRHWTAERKTQTRNQAELQNREKRLEREREILEQARRQFHGAAELEKRRLIDERQALEINKKDWQTRVR